VCIASDKLFHTAAAPSRVLLEGSLAKRTAGLIASLSALAEAAPSQGDNRLDSSGGGAQ
jgi:hypothetical protein